MLKRCSTAEDMRELERDIYYFYNHGGPAMDDNGFSIECAVTETNKTPANHKTINRTVKSARPITDHAKWRDVVHGGLEAEIAYFYEHGGPIMD